MKRYPKYKESGLYWIGKIPKHWKILPFTHCLKKVKTKKKTSIPKMDYQESGEFPVIDQGASFIAGWTDLTDAVISDNLPIVIFGDHTRIFKYVDFPFAPGADGTQLLYPNDDVLIPRFFYYALLNLKIPDRGYNRHSRYLRKFSVACPALPTQTQIANFLDRKTGHIDKLVHIKERQVALLQEQRKALINHAVTKGLDPNVEMKPSGIEWIGDIPKHWRCSRLKFHLTENSGGIWGKDDEFGNGTYVLRSTEITIDGQWDLQDIVRRQLSNEETERFLLKKGDLVVTKSSGSQDHIGKTGLVNEKIESMFVCYSNFVQRLRTPRHINSKFLHYLMNCPLAREQYKYQSETTTGLANLSAKSIDELLISVPPIQEQTEIADFLDRKIGQIDTLITAEQRKIELLKEYRQSLISEAVTGKIDVRNEG